MYRNTIREYSCTSTAVYTGTEIRKLDADHLKPRRAATAGDWGSGVLSAEWVSRVLGGAAELASAQVRQWAADSGADWRSRWCRSSQPRPRARTEVRRYSCRAASLGPWRLGGGLVEPDRSSWKLRVSSAAVVMAADGVAGALIERRHQLKDDDAHEHRERDCDEPPDHNLGEHRQVELRVVAW